MEGGEICTSSSGTHQYGHVGWCSEGMVDPGSHMAGWSVPGPWTA